MSTWKKGAAGAIVVVGLALVGWPLVRMATAPTPAAPSPAAKKHLENVRILRDKFGVPHVFGATDADAAFGLAFAHAEDDWKLIQGVMAASRGELGRHVPGNKALSNDYYAAFVDVRGEIDRTYGDASPELKAVFEGYAEGLNVYAYHHPDEANARLLPFTGRDVASAFVHKLPLMMKVDKVLGMLSEGEIDEGDVVFPGSNSQAVAREESADDVTRLNINTHQPWTGPVTFYEAHVKSAEGWNMSGALFPGAPFPLIGHNDHIGWALTVNMPDQTDLYALELEGDTYRFGDETRTLTSRSAWLPYETWWGTFWIPQTIRESVHGPVFEKGGDAIAVRTPAVGQGVRAAEEWYRMNKATNVEELRAALDLHAIPMFNVTYASRDHIGFVYNGRLPDRSPGHDYMQVLPGDDPTALWTDVLPLSENPQVHDPTTGWVQACNSSPYWATSGPEAPKETDALSRVGIETIVTNRTHRTHEILSEDVPMTRERFRAMKWDDGTSRRSNLWTKLIEPLADLSFDDPDALEVQRTLLAWDGQFAVDSVGAAMATLAWRPLNIRKNDVLPEWELKAAIQRTAKHLREHFGKLDVPLGDVQRLRRGTADLPLYGGPDVLHCTYGPLEGAHVVADDGDGYVMNVEFHEDGVRSWSIHQFGSAPGRPESPHHTDQAALFVQTEMKPVLRRETDIRKLLEADYVPGEDWKPHVGDVFETLKAAREILPDPGPAAR